MLVLYHAVKKSASIFFNLLNFILGGNLPPFNCVCVIVEEQGRYLVVERPRGGIVFPSGFVRWREQPAQAARREGKEETGLELQVGDMIGYHAMISHRFTAMSTVTLVFQAKVIGGALYGSIEGQPQWLDEQTLRKRLNQFSRQILDNHLRYRTRQPEASISSL